MTSRTDAEVDRMIAEALARHEASRHPGPFSECDRPPCSAAHDVALEHFIRREKAAIR
jgi:hypothetical protein